MEASALPHPVGLGRVSLAGPLLRLRTDEQLVALFRAGHDEAFGTIHDRYRARLFAYARQMLGGSRSDAEDVLQDVFLRAYNALRTDGRDVALRAWLYRVAHNRCIDQLRRPAPAAEDIYDINRGVSTDLLAEAERREDLRRLIADVRGLPEQQRSALLMREMEGLSYNDLASALGVTVPAVKSLLVRARVGLVEAIEARDTACVEIRDDLASAFDRGVRPSGRAKRHLKECAGCREYRGALRGLDKSLNGLALPSGPLVTVMKVLGIGGAGSGAAAGGGAAVVGGGGAGAAGAGGAAAAAGGMGVATTVSGGVVAATATKVAAVLTAAAVVGGGAAVEQQHHATRHAATAAPAAHVAAAPQRREDLPETSAFRVSHAAVATHRLRAEHGGGGAAGSQVTKLQTGSDRAVASPGADAVADQTTGGTSAPDDVASDPSTASDAPTTATWSGSANDSDGATGTSTTAAGTSGTTSTTGTDGSGSTTGASGTTGTTTATQASGPSAGSTGSASSGTGTGTGGAAAPAAGTQTSATPVAPANPSQPTG